LGSFVVSLTCTAAQEWTFTKAGSVQHDEIKTARRLQPIAEIYYCAQECDATGFNSSNNGWLQNSQNKMW